MEVNPSLTSFNLRSNLLIYTIDHIRPVSKGGGLVLDNVQLLCKSCNSIKHDKNILFRQPLPNLLVGVRG